MVEEFTWLDWSFPSFAAKVSVLRVPSSYCGEVAYLTLKATEGGWEFCYFLLTGDSDPSLAGDAALLLFFLAALEQISAWTAKLEIADLVRPGLHGLIEPASLALFSLVFIYFLF